MWIQRREGDWAAAAQKIGAEWSDTAQAKERILPFRRVRWKVTERYQSDLFYFILARSLWLLCCECCGGVDKETRIRLTSSQEGKRGTDWMEWQEQGLGDRVGSSYIVEEILSQWGKCRVRKRRNRLQQLEKWSNVIMQKRRFEKKNQE